MKFWVIGIFLTGNFSIFWKCGWEALHASDLGTPWFFNSFRHPELGMPWSILSCPVLWDKCRVSLLIHIHKLTKIYMISHKMSKVVSFGPFIKHITHVYILAICLDHCSSYHSHTHYIIQVFSSTWFMH